MGSKLRNVCQHLLNNSDLLKDPMYQKQVADAVAQDEIDEMLGDTGRWHEWEQHCQLTKVISNVAQGLKDSASAGNDQCRRAYKKLNAITMRLYLQPAEKCAARMPSLKPSTIK